MAKIFQPDVCPSKPSCAFVVAQKADSGEFVSAERVCDFHKGLGLTDEEVFERAIGDCKGREGARWAAKQALGLPKGLIVPYRMENDGGYTLGVDAKGNKLPEWPADGTPEHAAVMSAVSKAVR